MTQLFKKLNYKEGQKIICINTPKSFESSLAKMELETKVFKNLSKVSHVEFLIAFVTTLKDIEKIKNELELKMDGDITLWFCYPKGSSKKYSCEFNRDTGWASLGNINMEPVRQVAIDEDWSALRFRKVAFIKTLVRSKDYMISNEAKGRVIKG